MNEQHQFLLHAHDVLWEIRRVLESVPMSERAAALEQGIRAANVACPDPTMIPEMERLTRAFLQDVLDE